MLYKRIFGREIQTVSELGMKSGISMKELLKPPGGWAFWLCIQLPLSTGIDS